MYESWWFVDLASMISKLSRLVPRPLYHSTCLEEISSLQYVPSLVKIYNHVCDTNKKGGGWARVRAVVIRSKKKSTFILLYQKNRRVTPKIQCHKLSNYRIDQSKKQDSASHSNTQYKKRSYRLIMCKRFKQIVASHYAPFVFLGNFINLLILGGMQGFTAEKQKEHTITVQYQYHICIYDYYFIKFFSNMIIICKNNHTNLQPNTVELYPRLDFIKVNPSRKAHSFKFSPYQLPPQSKLHPQVKKATLNKLTKLSTIQIFYLLIYNLAIALSPLIYLLQFYENMMFGLTSLYQQKQVMQVEEEDKIQFAYTLEKGDRQFSSILFGFLRQSNGMDQLFLTRIHDILQGKNIIEAHQISDLSIVLSLSVNAPNQNQQKQPLTQIQQKKYTTVEQLQKVILQTKRPNKQKMQCLELMGWVSKIWDKMLHFSCYKNHLDLLVLYYFIGEFLLYPQTEFKRLLILLLQSVSKLKTIPDKTLEIVLHLLTFFSEANQLKILSTQTKTKLKLISVLYLAKMNDPSKNDLSRFQNKLQEIKDHYIHGLMDCLQKVEEGGSYYEEETIWDKLFTSLLCCYSKYDSLKEIILKIIIEMVSFKLDLQTMKLLIRQLEITNESKPLKKWKEIFHIMGLALKIYDRPKQCLAFLSPKSFIKYQINSGNSFFLQVQIKTSSKLSNEEKMLFMIQDKQRTHQIWIVMRQSSENQVILMLLKISNGIINQQQKMEAKWNIHNANQIQIQLINNEIILEVNSSKTSIMASNNTTFSTLVIGDEDGNFGTSIKSIYSLSIYSNSKRDNGLCHKMEINGRPSRGIRKKSLPSFVQIIKLIGDLDIFLMIISHGIKKLKKNDDIVMMIRESINLLQRFVEVKKVKLVKVTPAERQKRLNAILCLCWQCSHQTYNALAVLQLLRFLNIRGVTNPEDELQILCNFVFWKQFEWQYQKLMIMKIKELFSEIRIKENNHKFIKKYCQRILEETTLYYRQEQYVANGIQNKDNILKIHYEFITLVKQQLFYIINDKKSIEDYYDFIQFIVKLLYWTLSRKNNVIDAFDITLSVQFAIFGRQLAQKLKDTNVKDEKILKIVKEIIDVVGVYECQQPFYEERKIKVYIESKGFLYYEDKAIKENLYFLAYSLISLKQNLLHSIIDSDQRGINEINCIVWQKRIIEPLILAIDKSNFYQLTPDKCSQIKYLFERLSLKSLSYDQNKNLLTVYLNNDTFFNEKDYRLTQHFCKIVNIKDLLDLMYYSLKRQIKSELEPTISSKVSIQSTIISNKNEALKCDKVLSMLGICQQLTYDQGFMILSQLAMQQNPKETRLNLMIQHFTLKGLVQKTYQILQNNQQSIQFVTSLSENSHIEDVKKGLILNRGSLIYCLEFFLNHITAKDLQNFFGIANVQEAQCHLQNYRINIEGVMNSLGSTEINQIHRLKNYHYFLQKQLLPLSKFYMQQLNVKPIIQNKYNINRLRKGSKQQIEFPKIDFKQDSKHMYLSFLDERNFNLLKVEQVWLQVQERNKSFWSTFIGKQYYYSLYDGTGSLHERYLLKKDSKKPKLQLPKMILKGSCQRSASVISQRFEFNNDESASSIFDDAHLYRKQPISCINFTSFQEPSKQGHKSNKFKVLLINAAKIYQGTIAVADKKLIFKENQEINSELYEKIFAAQCEKRLEDECIKQNFSFEEQISDKCVAIVKRYLFHDIGVEIHTKNRSHFMTFNKRDHRQAFLYLIEKHMKVLTRDKLAQQAKVFTEKWENGFISNYHYLMKINDLTGRSFNDLSQYYVFPWTVTNFKDQIDANFFCRKENFRDLSLPIGKINKDKWEDIKKKYEMKKQMRNSELQIPTFLYGSFYSNRAIVCNYLIRISPFSTQHYELQSQKFDAADRLFYSIVDSYQSLNKCPADFKELIPQFYYFPDFLKNRCAYNLGQRQNKDIVHDVELPKWASDEYEFIFRMRKILQSQLISISLNHWIDLIFGVYANKKYAIKADNLFMGDLYLEGYERYLCQKDKTSIQLFKQFGQVPVPILNSNHTPIKFKSNFVDSINHPTMKIDEFVPTKINQSGKIVHLYFYKRFTFLLFEKQIRMFEEQKFQKDYVVINGDFQGGTLQVWEMFDTQNKKHYCITVHKKKTFQLVGYEIKKNLFNNYSTEHGDVFPFKHKCSIVCFFENYIFCADDKNIYIYKNIQEQATEEYSTHNFSLICHIGKTKYLLSVFGQFTHHKSRILFMKSNERGLIVSIDEQNKCFITQISSNKTSLFNFFQIKGTYFEERIMQLHIHNMGFLIMRTDYDRLLVYSFMGDNVVTKHLNFEKNASLSTEKPLTISIWNQQLSEVIIGTNLGNLWKIDLFELRKTNNIKEGGIWMEKVYLNKSGFRKEGLLKSTVKRIGRHSFTLVYAENNKVYTIKSQKWDQTKKVEVLGKKVPNFW